MKNKISEFKQWLYRMEHYGTISGASVETIVSFVDEQQKEINRLMKELGL